jgi:hypothetical protein
VAEVEEQLKPALSALFFFVVTPNSESASQYEAMKPKDELYCQLVADGKPVADAYRPVSIRWASSRSVQLEVGDAIELAVALDFAAVVRCDMNSDELDRDMLSWLKSNSIDNQADYLRRGRRYCGLQDGMLLEEWKKVFRAMAPGKAPIFH